MEIKKTTTSNTNNETLMGIFITVAIASCGRDSLRATIKSVDESLTFLGHKCEIIVADDSEGGIETQIPSDISQELRIIPVHCQNISDARNVCMLSAKGVWLAFIDDDEIAPREWLRSLTDAQEKASADIVCGAVSPIYAKGTPAHLIADSPYLKLWGEEGAEIEAGSTSNVLIRTSFLTRTGLKFRSELGRSGGEDTDFFYRARQMGAKIVATRHFPVEEIVPASRLSLSYRLQRSYRQGSVLSYILVSNGLSNRYALICRSSAAACFYLFRILLSPIYQYRLNRRMCIKFVEAVGKLSYCLRLVLGPRWSAATLGRPSPEARAPAHQHLPPARH